MGQLRANGKDVAHEAPAAEEGNIIVINTCGFIDNAKAESVNMILEYADKRKRFSRQGFVTGCLSERYRPDLEKEIPNVINILERLNYLHY
jgi:ribosomal protein S12 methylthiotransferase